MRWARRGIASVLILAMLVIGLKVYLVQYASSPQGAVEGFFSAYNNADIQGMVSCMEPGTEDLLSGGTELANAVVKALLGVDLHLDALIDVMPAFANQLVGDTEMVAIQNVQVLSYSPVIDAKLADFLVGLMPELVNVLADEAVVAFEIEDAAAQLEVRFYGENGWRIPLDTELLPLAAMP